MHEFHQGQLDGALVLPLMMPLIETIQGYLQVRPVDRQSPERRVASPRTSPYIAGRGSPGRHQTY